mgnify:CR=1 FL=1
MAEAAQALGISRQAVSQLVARGRLPAERYRPPFFRRGGAGIAVIPVAAVQAWRRRKKRLTDHKTSG